MSPEDRIAGHRNKIAELEKQKEWIRKSEWTDGATPNPQPGDNTEEAIAKLDDVIRLYENLIDRALAT